MQREVDSLVRQGWVVYWSGRGPESQIGEMQLAVNLFRLKREVK